ncbi:hypothetical protein PO902_09880 [Planococcus maritimus]|nr:hypothetical protein [Planococcus sp. SK3692]MDE4085331.1 hypothetical protein [Planococcus maritimus]
MKRVFLAAIILSALVAWGHFFFDLRTIVPDPVARLAVALALFVLFIGMMYWIVEKGRGIIQIPETARRGNVAVFRYIIRSKQNNWPVV